MNGLPQRLASIIIAFIVKRPIAATVAFIITDAEPLARADDRADVAGVAERVKVNLNRGADEGGGEPIKSRDRRAQKLARCC